MLLDVLLFYFYFFTYFTFSIYNFIHEDNGRFVTGALPLEEKQVEMVVFLGEEVAQDSGGVSTADLIG